MDFSLAALLIDILLALSPVFLFLFLFLIMDNLRLVSKKTLMACFGWGLLSASLSFLLNTLLIRNFHLDFNTFSHFIAPVVEELLKAFMILLLLRRGKIGFMIDGAIYGFSIGAAFSLAENIYYLIQYAGTGAGIMTWITRGFGTAVMHGGTTALFAILAAGSDHRRRSRILSGATGLILAILVHTLFNYLTVHPLAATLFIILFIPLALVVSFHHNEQSIRHWMEKEFDNEITVLTMIRKGTFSATRTGQYLRSIRYHFPAERVVDLYCFISLYTELSIRAKSIMMMKEQDFVISPDPSVRQKLEELKNLRKMIGRSGYLAIAPVLRMNRKDLWKLSLLSFK